MDCHCYSNESKNPLDSVPATPCNENVIRYTVNIQLQQNLLQWAYIML